jgi:hypothetical protein
MVYDLAIAGMIIALSCGYPTRAAGFHLYRMLYMYRMLYRSCGWGRDMYQFVYTGGYLISRRTVKRTSLSY